MSLTFGLTIQKIYLEQYRLKIESWQVYQLLVIMQGKVSKISLQHNCPQLIQIKSNFNQSNIRNKNTLDLLVTLTVFYTELINIQWYQNKYTTWYRGQIFKQMTDNINGNKIT